MKNKQENHIFICQAGYRTTGVKKAVLNFKTDEFAVIGEDGNVRMRGKTAHFGYDELSGDDVYIADFSDFAEVGRFFISADGVRSYLFDINENVYSEPLRKVMKAFYFLRCGCGLDERFAGKFRHASCHTEYARIYGKPDEPCDVSGGWHDAGDYGRYVTAGAVSAAHLLYAFEMFPKVFVGQNLGIPESGGELPDVLAECRVELEWLMKMQDTDGGVYHKVTTMKHAPFVMPEDDREPLYLFAVSSMAAADLAAVCSLASRIYSPYDKDFSDRLIAAAEKSAEWLKINKNFVPFHNPADCNTGVYGEHDDADNRFWALSELYCATGREEYHELMKSAMERNFSRIQLGYGSVGGLGALGYILSDRADKDEDIIAELRGGFLREALELKNNSEGCGYGAAMSAREYGWGSNFNLMKNAMIFLIADFIGGADDYGALAEEQLHILFGKNALGFSYVSGVGMNCMKHPHLRTAEADGIEECLPGFVSGGPNANLDDEAARLFIPRGTPPMKCYADNMECYSLNEITIYWNSSAAFVLAGITDRQRRTKGK